jgi:hypothetical protein
MRLRAIEDGMCEFDPRDRDEDVRDVEMPWVELRHASGLDLKAKNRRPATINRWLALLRHMFNWALGREYVTQTPFRRGTQALIKFERENNRRVRRVPPEEAVRLLAASNSLVHMLIVAALDTGMRRGESRRATR